MTRNAQMYFVSQCTFGLALLAAVGCASSRTANSNGDQEELEQARRQVQDLRDQITTLNGRLEGMEMKVASLHDELKGSRTSAETISRKKSDEQVEEVTPPASSGLGKAVSPTKAPSDPDAGFVTDAAVDAYRKAMILFDSKKYPESMLAFTRFLEQYADHPWAGAAQFYVGQSYFFQKECKLAIQEYQRVLTSYDRSSHVADSLAQMAACEDELKMPAAAAKHRQLLSSLFPNSPAARSLVAAATASPTQEQKPTTGVVNSQAPPVAIDPSPANAKRGDAAEAAAMPPTAPAEGTSKQ